MKKWLSKVSEDKKKEEDALGVPGPSSTPAPEPGADALALQNTIQALRMEIAARDEKIKHLTDEVERLRYRSEGLAAESAAARVQALLTDLSGPACQMLTQAALEESGRPLQARDVLTVAKRLLRAHERHGLVFEGKPGEQGAFDPDKHTPLNAEVSPQVGDVVTVRVAGAIWNGKTLYKAGVE